MGVFCDRQIVSAVSEPAVTGVKALPGGHLVTDLSKEIRKQKKGFFPQAKQPPRLKKDCQGQAIRAFSNSPYEFNRRLLGEPFPSVYGEVLQVFYHCRYQIIIHRVPLF